MCQLEGWKPYILGIIKSKEIYSPSPGQTSKNFAEEENSFVLHIVCNFLHWSRKRNCLLEVYLHCSVFGHHSSLALNAFCTLSKKWKNTKFKTYSKNWYSFWCKILQNNLMWSLPSLEVTFGYSISRMHMVKEVVCCNYINIHVLEHNAQQQEVIINMTLFLPRKKANFMFMLWKQSSAIASDHQLWPSSFLERSKHQCLCYEGTQSSATGSNCTIIIFPSKEIEFCFVSILEDLYIFQHYN